jgi:hypothetical protein
VIPKERKYAMKIERGDSVKFGKKWCKNNRRKDLVNKVVRFTPQWFETDNGLYCDDIECPGIWDEVNDEAESIFHLFGNHFEKFMDCELFKGTEDDKVAYQKIIQNKAEVESKYWEQMAESTEYIEEIIPKAN